MVTSVIVGLLMAAAPAPGGWTQWRGPNRDGVSAELASTPWPGELSRRWRTPVGSGQSSPVVHGRTAYVFTREEGSEVARALDLGSGRVLWRQAYPAPYKVYPGAASYGSGPKSTPVVHDGRLFTLGIGGILTAFDAASGRIAWQKDFAGRFAAPAPPFGTSMSPLVVNGLLVVHAGGHDGGALLALDPATGAERWTVAGEGPSYSSPILATLGGAEQIVIQVHRKVLGVDPSSGRILWSVPFVTPCDQNIVTPLQAGDRILVSSVDKGLMAIAPARSGSAWSAPVAWETKDVSLYMSSPVLAGGRVWGLSHKKKGQFFALDPQSGAVRWTSDGHQGETAAFVVAGESVLALQGDGTLLLLPADAASFAPSRRYPVGEGATYAHPVPTASGLLVKDEEGLSLYGTAASAKAAAR